MLTHPHRRELLLYYLKVLSNPELQKSIWLEHQFIDDSKYDSFDEAVHFFFDDSALANNPAAHIGNILYDNDEVELIMPLTQVMGSIIDELGDVKDEIYLAHPRWSEVIAHAKQAYEKLQQMNNRQ